MFNHFIDKIKTWVDVHGIQVIVAILILVIGEWIITFIKRWMRNVLRNRETDSALQPFLLSLFTITLRILLVIFIMQWIGIRMTIFAALIGAFGVAAGLALAGTLQNFTGGILILLLKPYKIGDYIIAQGSEGRVVSIELFYTIILTRDSKSVIIPNSKLSNEVIINLTMEGRRRVDSELKFTYGIDIGQAKKIMLEAAKQTEHVLNNPAPEIGISVLEPDGYRLTLRAWTDSDRDDYEEVRFDLQERMINSLKVAGIKLPGM